ncbi:hypothetical protein OROHE_022747 [Orobanche hederae]
MKTSPANMGSSAASNSESIGTLEPLKRKSEDVGWEYGELVNGVSNNKVRYKLCKQEMYGGVNRLKQHIAHIRGNVRPCNRSTPLDKEKCKRALEELKKKKVERKEHVQEVRGEVRIGNNGDWGPSMAFVYGEIIEAKNEIIRACKNSKETYEPILEIIDSKMKGRLDKDVVGRDASCMAAVLACIEAFFPDNYDLQDMFGNVELPKYKNMEGMFGRKLAIMGRSKNEDNFDIGIHTKKQNRLDVERLNNLVYVQFNAKLVNKKNKMKEKCVVLLATDASEAQGWIVEGGDDEELSQDSTISTDNNKNEA